MTRPEPPSKSDPALRRLDERVVPALRRRLRAMARVLASPAVALARFEEQVAGGRALRFGIHYRRELVLAAVLIAAAGSFLHLQRFPELQEAQRAQQTPSGIASPREPATAVADGGDGAAVGPVLGERLASYTQRRQDALADLPGDTGTAAVVSFGDYLDPAAAEALLPDGIEVVSAQYRVPAEGERPLEAEVVDGDLTGSMERAIEAAIGPILAEIEEARALVDSGTVEDEGFREDLERRIEELSSVRNLLDSSARVVFAVVVVADGDQLRELARSDAVRLVDVAPTNATVAESRFFGLVPEDDDVASFGA